MTVFVVYIIFILLILILAITALYFIHSLLVRQWLKIRLQKVKQEMSALIGHHLAYPSIKEIPGEEILYMQSLISGRYGLQAFQEVHALYIKNQGYTEKIRQYTECVISMKLLLNSRTVRERYRNSYILYILAQFQMRSAEVKSFAFRFLEDPSLYDRYHALRIAYNSGETGFFIEALRCIDQSERYYNDKVLVDAMDNFSGNQRELNDLLHNEMIEFSSRFQRLIIEHDVNVRRGDEDTLIKRSNGFDRHQGFIAARKEEIKT